MSKKIATFKDLDTLASLDTGASAGYISGAENEQCVTKGNFVTVSTETIAAKGNGLMFVDDSESSNYESNRLILLDDVQYISEITAVLVSAPNIPAKGGSAYATWKLSQSYKANGDASPSIIEWQVTGSVVEASSKGTTISAVTDIANSEVTVTNKGKSISLSQMIKQDSNEIIEYGNWTAPTVTVNPTSFAAAGGTATITISGDSTRQNTWSSGSKSTDTAYKSNKSASFATISSDYKTLTVSVNTTGSSRTGKVYVDWSFDNTVVKSVESNSYSQIAQTACTMSLTSDTKVYHNTAVIKGKASVKGKIYWGTSSGSMSNVVSISAVDTDTQITSRDSLGTTTIYAYFVPDSSEYTTLGSSSKYHASASAKITQASDASMAVSTSNKTYNGSSQSVVTCSSDQVHGTSEWYIGYTTTASSNSPTWGNKNVNLSLTNAGTYYIWIKWIADGNHSNSNTAGTKLDATVTISKRTVTITAPTKTDRTYSGSAQTIFAAGSCTAGGTMYYSDTNKTFSTSTWSTSVPTPKQTNAGSYTLYYYCYVSDTANNTGTGINTIKSISATISKKATTAPTLTAGSKTTYDGSAVYAQAATGSGNPAGTIYYGASSGATTYSITASTTAANLTKMGQTNVGTTTIYAFFRPTDTTNYADSSVVSTTAKVVNKKDTTAPTLTAGSKATYDGKTVYAQAASSSSNPAGKIYYGASSGATTYSITASTTATNLSSMGQTNVGTTTIYAFFRPTDTTNYADSSVASTTAKVTNKAAGSITVNRLTPTYTGSAVTIATATATGDYQLGIGSSSTSAPSSWGSANAALTATTAGTYYVWAKCGAGTNHNAVSQYYVGTATINKKATTAPTLTAGSKTTYDGSAVYAQAATGSGNPAGKIYYGASSGATTYSITASTTSTNLSSMGQTNVGTTTIYAFFRPTDTTNYADSSVVSTTAKVVNKKATNAPTLTAGEKTTYDGKTVYAQAVTGSGNPAGKICYGATSGAETYSITASTTATNLTSMGRSSVGTTTIYAFFKPNDATNYSNSSVVSTTAKVTNKATPTLIVTADFNIPYDGDTHYASATSQVAGTIYYGLTTSSMTNTKSVSAGGTVELTACGTSSVGQVKVYAYLKPSDTTNYNNSNTSNNTIRIVPAASSLTLTGVSKTYDGSTSYVSATSSLAGTVYYGTSSSSMTNTKSITAGGTITLDASGCGRSSAGSTTIYAYLDPTSSNYNNSSTVNAKITISKKSSTITFNDSTISAQCLNSSDKLTSATNTSAFTAATLSDGGSITYSIVSGNISGTVSLSSSSRKISIPKDTAVGTYTVTVKASQSNSNYSSDDKTATITIKVDPDTLKDGFSGTLSIDSSADLSAGADSRTITWGAIYQTWANGGGKYYYSSNNAYLDISCNNSTAGTYISIDEFSYGNSSSTTTSTLTKMTFDIKELSASTLTISLKNYSHSTVKTLTVNVSKNEKTLTGETILNYGNPTLSIGGGLTASGGSANIGCSVTNIVNYAYKYTSGGTSNNTTGKSGSAEWKILSQSCAGGGTRFAKSGNILAHTTMGSNEGVDSITLQAYNIDDTTKTATTGTTIDNYRKHTITSITLTYTDASGSAYSTNIPTVKYNTSYTYPSGASGGTTVNQTSDELNTKTVFTKSFKYGTSNTYSSLNESTGVVTWNTAAPSKRSCTVKCTGTLTSYGSASSKTSSEVYANQLGTMTDLIVNNNGCYSRCTYSVYITGQSPITINSYYTTGTIFSKTLSEDPITITVHGTNNMSGSTTKLLKVSHSGGGSSVSINPIGGVNISSQGGTGSVTVTLDRYDYASATSIITISFG